MNMDDRSNATPTVRLYQGDCLEVLKTLDAGSINAVVSDPPYGVKHKPKTKHRKGDTKWGGYTPTEEFVPHQPIIGDDKPFDPSLWLGFPLVAMTGPQWYYDRLPPGGSWHCWNKRGDYKPICQADADFVWLSKPMPARTLKLVWRGLCREVEYRDKIVHPTQKPVALMEWILGLLKLKPGMTVLDPYMGSGTTGVACMKAGINFIGIEIDPAYFATAERRIREASNTLPLAG